MSVPNRDPERNEQHILDRYASPKGQSVLEIGCGEGRLTRLFASEAKHLIGTEVSLPKLRAAHLNRPECPAHKVDFVASSAVALPFVNENFDLALFSWSL